MTIGSNFFNELIEQEKTRIREAAKAIYVTYNISLKAVEGRTPLHLCTRRMAHEEKVLRLYESFLTSSSIISSTAFSTPSSLFFSLIFLRFEA